MLIAVRNAAKRTSFAIRSLAPSSSTAPLTAMAQPSPAPGTPAPSPHLLSEITPGRRTPDISPTSTSSSDFLASSPRGAYTTARSVGRHSVFEFEFHAARLANSVKLMLEADGHGEGTPVFESLKELTDPKAMRGLYLSSLSSAMKSYMAAHPAHTGELKLTTLVHWTPTGDSWNFVSHVTSLGERPRRPVKAVIRGAPRHNASAKDSEWVRARKGLEDGMAADVNEVILMSSDGTLFEGLSSNFFAVVDGAVHTAGAGILSGTVREAVLEVCKDAGIPVVLESPNVADLPRFEGAFISSTSRLVLPLDELAAPDVEGAPVKRFEYKESDLTKRVEALLLAAVEARSGRVLEG